MKKVLILTVTAGNGHNSAANAIKNRLLHSTKEKYEVEVSDTLKECAGNIRYGMMRNGYSQIMSKAPKIYESGFRISKKLVWFNKKKGYSHLAALSVMNKLYKKINTFQPDVIYCTHFIPAIAISDLRLYYKVPPVVIMSELDYYNTPFFEAATGVDYFTLSDESLTEENIKNGFKKDQLIVTGIPIDPKFEKPIPKLEVREKLGLDKNAFTVLVMFGGGEWSGIKALYEALVDNVREEMQIIIINGRNKDSFDQINEIATPDPIKLRNLGFVDNVYEYMFASDVAITKAGGLSTTEMIAAELPMIIYEKVYAQEKENLNFLKKKGLAVGFSEPKELPAKLWELRKDYDRFRKNVRSFKKNATEDICRLIEDAPHADYDAAYISALIYPFVKYNVRLTLEEMFWLGESDDNHSRPLH